jgi:hypothetical protein
MTDSTSVISEGNGQDDFPKCAFLGIRADFYIGLATMDHKGPIGYFAAVCSQMVDTAIVNLLGKGSGDMNWPVVLDLEKKVVYHSYDAHLNGLSATQGWSEHCLKNKSI